MNARRSVVCSLALMVLLMTMAACVLGSRLKPDLGAPPVVVVRMQPDRAWTDTGVTVQKGEELFFTAAGEVYWEARNTAAGPDGVKGYPGWIVGAGGLIGRVETSKIFALGARTQSFLAPNPRGRRHYYPPPPLR